MGTFNNISFFWIYSKQLNKYISVNITCKAVCGWLVSIERLHFYSTLIMNNILTGAYFNVHLNQFSDKKSFNFYPITNETIFYLKVDLNGHKKYAPVDILFIILHTF